MARTSCRSILVAAVIALIGTGAATRRSEEVAYAHAYQLFAQGRWSDAESFLQDTLANYAQSDVDEVWGMRALYGQVLTARANYSKAFTILSAELPPRLRNSEIAVRWSSYRAVLLYRMNQRVQAKAALAHAEALARRKQPQTLDDVMKWKANFAFNDGQQESGEQYTYQGLRLARQYHHKQTEAELLATLAIIRTKRQRVDEAIDLGLRALTLAEEVHAESLIEKTQGNLGWAYSLIGDYVNHRFYAERALSLAEKLGAERDRLTWINQMGNAAHLKGDHRAALAYYSRAADLARSQNHTETGDYVADLAVAYLETGDLANARRYVAESKALDRGKHDIAKEMRTVLIDARIDAAAGDMDSAIAKAQIVIDRAEDLAQRGEAQARIALFCESANKPEEAEIHFRSAIHSAAVARRDIKSEELRLSFGTLVREVYDDYITSLLMRGRTTEALQVAELSRSQTLEEALGAPEVERREFDPKHIARQRHAVILSFWLAPKHSYVWTITSSSVEVAELPAAEKIEALVDRYSNEIRSVRASSTNLSTGADLYKMLVAPVVKRIPAGSRLVIIPDGRLHSFNMETLVEPSTQKYWIETVTIETVGSLELLDRPRKGVLPESMLLVGDPPSPALEFPRLEKASREMEFVKKHFPGACTVLRGAAATPRTYTGVKPNGYGFIHFVAHGVATLQRPLDSAVVLGRDEDLSYKLYAREIIKHPLRARLVTISSCHGAGTRAYVGEGLVGLAWAFLHAGARQVIAALWEVNDDATPRLMDSLYAGIRAGHDPATALRDAKLTLIRGGTVYRQPRYWAPFVLYSGS